MITEDQPGMIEFSQSLQFVVLEFVTGLDVVMLPSESIAMFTSSLESSSQLTHLKVKGLE